MEIAEESFVLHVFIETFCFWVCQSTSKNGSGTPLLSNPRAPNRDSVGFENPVYP